MKLSLWRATVAHRVVRRQGSHIFYKAGSRMAMGFWRYVPAALCAQGDSWWSFLLEAVLDPRAVMRLEGLGQLRDPVTSPGIETARFWLVTWYLGPLRYHVPPYKQKYVCYLQLSTRLCRFEFCIILVRCGMQSSI